jgi:hypothetical protein
MYHSPGNDSSVSVAKEKGPQSGPVDEGVVGNS